MTTHPHVLQNGTLTPALEAALAAGSEMQIRYTNRQPVAGVPWQFEPTLVVITAGGAVQVSVLE